jgi:hypothetical protein
MMNKFNIQTDTTLIHNIDQRLINQATLKVNIYIILLPFTIIYLYKSVKIKFI